MFFLKVYMSVFLGVELGIGGRPTVPPKTTDTGTSSLNDFLFERQEYSGLGSDSSFYK